MNRYLFNRIIQSILVLLGVMCLVFFLLRIVGDPVQMWFSGRTREIDPETIAEFRRSMGFDLPLPVQFINFMRKAIVGDFGNSFRYKLPASMMIIERIPATLKLTSISLLVALIVSIPLGVMAAVKSGGIIDDIARTLALISQATPTYWLGLVLISIFAVKLRWLPSSGSENWKHYILPVACLALSSMGGLIRLTRSSVLEVLQEDYVRTAVSKGLRKNVIYYRHILVNAALPLVTVIGMSLGGLLGGALYIETIFAWPGMGRLVSDAVGLRDFPIIQGVAFLTCLIVVCVNLLTDVIYTFIDPRIRYGD
ncbi:MAG: ABC transporter permease [Anaerolineales bacterium]|nr:ABC transporter permease [Anaerolineales bacterium]